MLYAVYEVDEEDLNGGYHISVRDVLFISSRSIYLMETDGFFVEIYGYGSACVCVFRTQDSGYAMMLRVPLVCGGGKQKGCCIVQ